MYVFSRLVIAHPNDLIDTSQCQNNRTKDDLRDTIASQFSKALKESRRRCSVPALVIFLQFRDAFPPVIKCCIPFLFSNGEHAPHVTVLDVADIEEPNHLWRENDRVP